MREGATCWTPIGSLEPSKYLPFLIHFRKIVESSMSDEKLKEFLKIEDIPELKEFWLKHKEKGDRFYMSYVYGTLCDIPYVRDLAFIKVPTLLVYFTPSKVAALAT